MTLLRELLLRHAGWCRIRIAKSLWVPCTCGARQRELRTLERYAQAKRDRRPSREA